MMTKAELNNHFIATAEGEVIVYNYSSETREYLSSSIEYLVVGVGIPANSCIDEPGKHRMGYAICRTQDQTGWEYIPDHRGVTVYSTLSGEVISVSDLGDYPVDTTQLPPATPYDVWSGTEWVTDVDKKYTADVEAAEKQKAAIIEEARATISLWQTELQLGVISDKDKASLINWLAYIRAVQAVDVTAAPDLSWPELPA